MDLIVFHTTQAWDMKQKMERQRRLTQKWHTLQERPRRWQSLASLKRHHKWVVGMKGGHLKREDRHRKPLRREYVSGTQEAHKHADSAPSTGFISRHVVTLWETHIHTEVTQEKVLNCAEQQLGSAQRLLLFPRTESIKQRRELHSK